MREDGWKNRIIATGSVDPRTLAPNEANYRMHTEEQKQAMDGILEEVGWVQNIIVNKATGNVIDGHLRVQLALQSGEPEVPVSYVHLEPDEERLVLVTLDPIRALAVIDSAKHKELADAVQPKTQALADMLDEMADRRTAATSFLDNIINRNPERKKLEWEKDSTPLSFRLSHDQRDEILAIVFKVKEDEGYKTTTEAVFHILKYVAEMEGREET